MLMFRNEIDYNYSNLWLFIEIVKPGGEAVKDTFEVDAGRSIREMAWRRFGQYKNTTGDLPA